MSSKIRVLLVDDDEAEFVLIRDLLDEIGPDRYELTWESTYTDGYASLVSGRFDVCLLDYRIEERSGIDLLSGAVAEGCTTPMVMLIGMGDSEVDSAAMQAGAADYVVKGIIGADTLERILRHAIERSAGWRRIVEAEAKQLAMMEGIPDTVLRVSPDGVVLGYSAGVTSDPADGPVTENITLAETFGDRIAATVMNAVKTTLMSGGASSCEFTREGMFMMRSFEARVVAIEDANEAAVIIRDVTDERAASRRLDDLAQAKDRFLARISHDLRTPLATVLGYADLLGSEWSEFTPEERGEMIDAVASAAHELGDLFEDALVMARHEIDGLELARTRVDLAWHASRAAEGLKGGPAVDASVDYGDAFAVVDPGRLDQILRHMVSNAVMHSGPRREIVVGQAGGISWVEVRDDGVSIRDDERAWIFDPFDRSSHSLDNGASTGVGLAVSRKLTHLMEGGLTYHRESGWTTFRLEFPAASAPDGSEFGERTEAGGSSIVAAGVGAAGEPRREAP